MGKVIENDLEIQQSHTAAIGESLAQFEKRINPQVYVGRITRSTMYEKAPFC